MQTPFLAPVPPLQAPFWERQTYEPPEAYAAFLAWLCGGKELQDFGAAIKATGLDYNTLLIMSQRHVWEIRATEWIAHVRAVAKEATSGLVSQLKEIEASRIRTAIMLQDLIEREATKLRNMSEKSTATVVTANELARLETVQHAQVQALVRAAEGIPAELGAGNGPDWSKLTPQELEMARQLREKAKAG